MVREPIVAEIPEPSSPYDEEIIPADDPALPLPWETAAPLDPEELADLATLSRRLDDAGAWLDRGIERSLALPRADGQDL